MSPISHATSKSSFVIMKADSLTPSKHDESGAVKTYTHFLCCFQKHILDAVTSGQQALKNEARPAVPHRQRQREMTAAKPSGANNMGWLPDLCFHGPSGGTMVSLFSPGSSHQHTHCHSSIIFTETGLGFLISEELSSKQSIWSFG